MSCYQSEMMGQRSSSDFHDNCRTSVDMSNPSSGEVSSDDYSASAYVNGALSHPDSPPLRSSVETTNISVLSSAVNKLSLRSCPQAVAEGPLEFIDITKPFLEATKILELGELFHDKFFGLFEAMSAIEIMDPKMDAGMVCNKGKRAILNFEESINNGNIKLCGFADDELIGIMDCTLSCLVTWVEGHSLAQTIFTNLFLHDPNKVKDKTLHAYCVAVLKLVDIIEECINKAAIFEEEDFQPSSYGYKLATDVSESKVTSMLRDSEDEIQAKIKKFLISQNKKLDESEISQAVEHLYGVQARLKFIRFLYLLLVHLWKRDNLAECPKLLSLCFESLTNSTKSASIGIKRSSDENERFMLGFELLVNQRLLPPTFPRSTRIKSLEGTYAFLEGFLNRIKTVMKVTSLHDFHAIIDFFNNFSESQPCVLSRSLLQLLYAPMRSKKPGVEDMINSMKEAVKEFIAPPILMSKIPQQLNKEVGDCIQMFFGRCAPTFASLLTVCGHNRARQRDKLAQILEDFSTLQGETERMDAYIHNLCLNMEGVRPHLNCFGNWILYHISKLMIRYVLTGFELELYSIHEFGYVYWYLYEFPYGWLLSALSRADSYVTEGEAVSNNNKSKKGVKGKNKGSSKRARIYTKEICVAQAEQHLAEGYFKAMCGLTVDHRIPFPNPEFDDESVRYKHRFAAFSTIGSPILVHYTHYRNVSNVALTQPSGTMFDVSARHFQQAKSFLEAIPNPEKQVSDLLKIAKTNLVVVKLLASGHTKNSRIPPEFDFSCHPHFPIIKVK